jgi:hypothetical protein
MQKTLTKTDSPPPSNRDLELLARWMDSAFRIPGLGWRFGWDVILGLFPGAGDFATSLVSIYIFAAASRYGVSRFTVARMALNIVIDLIVGAIPFVGDAFDVYWKSNQRNVELLRRHVGAGPAEAKKLTTSDRLFVAGLAMVILAVLIGSIVVAYWIASSIWTALNRSAG